MAAPSRYAKFPTRCVGPLHATRAAMTQPIHEFSEATLRKFAAVYAEAVLTYLDSGEAQWVLWDETADLFDFASVELDQPSLPILLFVDESWSRLCEVDAVIDPEERGFDAGLLREAIETQIADEGLGERILRKWLERRAEQEEEDEEAAERGREAPARDED